MFDLAARDSIGEQHRKGSVAGRTHTTRPASALIIPTPPAGQRGTAARPYGARHPIIGRRRRKRGRTKAADPRYRIEAERGRATEGDVVDHHDPEDIAKMLVALWVGIRRVSDLDQPELYLDNLHKAWVLALAGFANPDRIDYFTQFIKRRHAFA